MKRFLILAVFLFGCGTGEEVEDIGWRSVGGFYLAEGVYKYIDSSAVFYDNMYTEDSPYAFGITQERDVVYFLGCSGRIRELAGTYIINCDGKREYSYFEGSPFLRLSSGSIVIFEDNTAELFFQMATYRVDEELMTLEFLDMDAKVDETLMELLPG